MAKQIAQIQRAGGVPELAIRFGDANIGVWRLFRWDAARKPQPLESGADQATLALGPAVELEGVTIGYEAIIQSPGTGPNQPYAMFLEVRQDGQSAPGGGVTQTGVLNPDGAKSVIGFISFQLS